MVIFNYYGHACFELETGFGNILFDPFLTGNPAASIEAKDVSCDYILLTHAHGDHFGDAVEIAQNNNAKVISTPEVLGLFPSTYQNVHGMNLGGSYDFPFGTVTMVPALHSAGVAGGTPCGFVLRLKEDLNIYFAGDTALFSDMKLIGERQKIDCAILPIGDNYTMGMEDAAKAVKLIKPTNVIPVHYNTWDVIRQRPEVFKMYVESKTPAAVHIVNPGESWDLTNE